jgi:hypothetical protein
LRGVEQLLSRIHLNSTFPWQGLPYVPLSISGFLELGNAYFSFQEKIQEPFQEEAQECFQEYRNVIRNTGMFSGKNTGMFYFNKCI